MAQFTLFYSIRSPFARRVRIVMQRLGVPFEAREISVFDPPADLLEANPLATVPALVVREGLKPGESLSICDSATILEYLNDRFDQRVWPSNPVVRAQVRAASTLAEGVMTQTVMRFLEGLRSVADPATEKEYEDNILRTLGVIARQPLNQLPWKISDLQMTQAAYDLAVALEYLEIRVPEVQWRPQFPTLAQFLDSHRTRQDLASTAPPKDPS